MKVSKENMLHENSNKKFKAKFYDRLKEKSIIKKKK